MLFVKTISAQCCISYRSQSFNYQGKSNDWFLYGMQHWDEMSQFDPGVLPLIIAKEYQIQSLPDCRGYFLIKNSQAVKIINHITNHKFVVYITVNHENVILVLKIRSSRSELFRKKGALKIFANLPGKHLCWRLFLKKLQE